MVDYTLFCGRKSVLDLSEESLFFEREREREREKSRCKCNIGVYNEMTDSVVNGVCLLEVLPSESTPSRQNFSNWSSYYSQPSPRVHTCAC